MKKLIFLLMMMMGLTATAQVDLAAQRAERQDPGDMGRTADPSPYGINPRPKSLKELGGTLDASRGFETDVDFLPRAKKKGVKIHIEYSRGPVDIDGGYILQINKKDVAITAADEQGAFYALQTLRQIVDATGLKAIPRMKVIDYPELPRRGVVEGFYGTPWSHAARLSLIDFYGRNKLNTYIYGPKDDPYHSSPNWRLPYPEAEARNIHELVEACRRNHVDFVWAAHPGKDIRWDAADRDSLLRKFEMMYDLGVRNFALFFDDIEGEGTNPYRQVELLNWLTDNFVTPKGDVGPLAVCPTDYSRLWANPTEHGANAIYGRELRPEIQVMYTGDVVCSDLTADTMNFFNALIRRPGYYWWNWPVTDYARNFLLQGPAYGLDTSLTSAEVAALVSNPMEHAEASKLGLYGVADYAWNPLQYSPLENWERGLRELMPECPEAYRTFAIHSADTATGYRRHESWETDSTTLRADLEALIAAVDTIRERAGNRALVAELSPWLDAAQLLGRQGLEVLDAATKAEARAAAEEIKKADAETPTLGTLHLRPMILEVYENLPD